MNVVDNMKPKFNWFIPRKKIIFKLGEVGPLTVVFTPDLCQYIASFVWVINYNCVEKICYEIPFPVFLRILNNKR